MTLACPPLLRFALHALLALAVLLQASMALAMGASPRGPDAAQAEPAAMVPPCHAIAGADLDGTTPPPPCCTDSALGESCRWACAQALSVTLPVVLATARPRTDGPDAGPILPALRWTAQSPLRPPIG